LFATEGTQITEEEFVSAFERIGEKVKRELVKALESDQWKAQEQTELKENEQAHKMIDEIWNHINSNCSIPSCPNFGRYCRLHSKLLAALKEPTPIKKKSDKRAAIDSKEYLPKARKYIKAHPVCELKLKGCTGKTQGVHHTEGKETIAKLLDESTYMAACNHCNLMAEIKDAEARSKGIKKSKHGKTKLSKFKEPTNLSQ
jgi:hypothetical protein